MKPSIAFLVAAILLASAQGYDLNGSFEYDISRSAFYMNSINSSNSSLYYKMGSQERAEVAISGKPYLSIERSGIHFLNQSVYINYGDSYRTRHVNDAIGLKNRSNLSELNNAAKINASDEGINDRRKSSIEQTDEFSMPAWASNAQMMLPANFNSDGKNLTSNIYQDLTTYEADKIDKPEPMDPRNKSKIVEGNAEGTQAAAEAATQRDIVEIDREAYNKSILIDKNLNILGPDVEGRLSIIDTNGMENINLKKPADYFMNQSANINYGRFYNIAQANAATNLRNESDISALFGAAKFDVSHKQIYGQKKLAIGSIDKCLIPAWASNARIFQTAISNSAGNNITSNIAPDFTISELNEADKSIPADLSKKSKIVVHAGDSIQAAINSATLGEVIEINSGTYDENILIDKSLTIWGIDVGGGLPIIDGKGMGNVVEISADQVILKEIAATNSSRSCMSPGAGIRFSSSDNCSIEGIVSYNNYYGINLMDSDNNTISKSSINNSEYGVRIFFSNNNSLEQNNVTENTNPLDIVSSEGNLIQGNIFRGNLHEVETSKENKIINNEDAFAAGANESKGGVELNAGPISQPSQSHDEETESHQSSDKDGDGVKWIPYETPIDKGKNEYKNFAQNAAGTLVFNPPKSMTNGTVEWIDARIGPENTTRLVQGLLGKGEVQFRNISVETNMTYVVKLEGDMGLKISAKRPEIQILGKDPAVWLWLVTPLEAGNHTLILSVDLQVEKPPYNCRCINVTYWPVTVKVLEPSTQQRLMDIMRSSYSLIVGSIAFLASLFSLIMLFRQIKKGTDEKKIKSGKDEG